MDPGHAAYGFEHSGGHGLPPPLRVDPPAEPTPVPTNGESSAEGDRSRSAELARSIVRYTAELNRVSLVDLYASKRGARATTARALAESTLRKLGLTEQEIAQAFRDAPLSTQVDGRRLDCGQRYATHLEQVRAYIEAFGTQESQ